jgi:hypothetical protein
MNQALQASRLCNAGEESRGDFDHKYRPVTEGHGTLREVQTTGDFTNLHGSDFQKL